MEKAPQPAITVKTPGRGPSITTWTLLILVLAQAVFCWREHDLRLRAEEKMRTAYLQMNDERGRRLEKTDTVRRSASELRELRAKVTELEKDNLNKEQKVSDLTKRLHESEMKNPKPEVPSK